MAATRNAPLIQDGTSNTLLIQDGTSNTILFAENALLSGPSSVGSTFTGTGADETITPGLVSPTVAVSGTLATPSDADDVVDAGGGADTIDSSGGADTVRGGTGNDVAFLGAGNDVFIWNPGDGSDTVEGGADADRLAFFGNGVNENFDVSANGGRVRFTRDVGNVIMDLDDVETITLRPLGGTDNATVNDLSGTDVTRVAIDLEGAFGSGAADGQADNVTVTGTAGADAIAVAAAAGSVSVTGLPASVDITHSDAGLDFLTIQAGAGDDVINASTLAAGTINLSLEGGLGRDVMFGSAGNDTVRGGDGDDTALLGAGDDVFIWNPGDDNDIVEGQAGSDRLAFFGANVNERIDISANGGRVRFNRDIANVVMDLNDVETVTFRALGGIDTVTVNDLSGTDVTKVAIDLEGAFGSGAGDNQVDTVIVNGGNGDEQITVASVGGVVTVSGLAAQVTIDHAETTDKLVVNGLGGNDFINATGLPAAAITLTLDGGAGDDTLAGGFGADTFFGGDGNDIVAGRQGNDTAFLGAGDDTFFWNPGDGSDTVEGGAGTDTLGFRGANVDENIDISANGGRVRFFRDVGNVTMDLDDVEHITFNAIGGKDNVVVNDLSGTDVTQVDIDLAATLGGTTADGLADQVTINGTAGDDVVTVSAVGGAITVGGLAATVNISHADANLDFLTVQAGSGADVINATGLAAGQINLSLDGGLGNDVILGSDGNDTVRGGDGDDAALLGAGDDVFIWNPGDDNDTIEGQAGSDRLAFFGNGANESIDISANGGRVLFHRDVANVTMDLDGVETTTFRALGGTDKVTVNDLSGTDLTKVAIDLEGAFGSGTGDGQVDKVIVNAGNGAESITVVSIGSTVTVNGLATQVTIDHAEATDQLTVNGLGGADRIDASGLAANSIGLILDGGAGNDALIGSAGADHFVYAGGGGADAIANFTHSQGDVIELHGTGVTSFAQLQALMVDHGTHTTIDFGSGNSLDLTGLHPNELQANDFLFL